MKLKFAAALLSTTIIAGSALAAEGPVPRGIAHLDHVWLIMMENHGYNQIIGNPSAPSSTAKPPAPTCRRTTSRSAIPA
jgi:hypothetical protein